MAIWVESDLCDGCKLCLKACPYDAVELKSGKAEILERCTSCGACLEVCKKKGRPHRCATQNHSGFQRP